MLQNVIIPSIPHNIASYYETILSISGMLLGLAFAGLIYVIQDGFSSFKFSRRMFLEYYVRFGQNLLISLAYLTIISVLILFLPSYPLILSIVFYLFALLFIKTLMDYYKQLGYLSTILTDKFVPSHYGNFRSYFRYIRNLGLLRILLLLISILIFIGYPIFISFYENESFFINSGAFFYSTLLILAYSIFRIINFIPRFFQYTQIEMDREVLAEDESNHSDYQVEKSVLKKYLESKQLDELDPLKTKSFLDGNLRLEFLDRRVGSEAWFNIRVSLSSSNTVFEIHDSICSYAYDFLRKLQESQVDINTFVLSFNIRIKDDKPRVIFLRTSRSELQDIMAKLSNPIEVVLTIENKLFDDLFKNLTDYD